MRIVYYTRPPFLDPALSFAKEMSQQVEMHLLLEVSPESWQSSLFDIHSRYLPEGIVNAESVLSEFPAGVHKYWRILASFNLVIHNQQRSIHPATWWNSHKAIHFIRNLKPDLLHLDDVSLRLSLALSGLGKIPVVMNVHDPKSHTGEHNWRNDLARKLTFAQVSKFILHSEALRQCFCALYDISPYRVETIPLGVYDIFRNWGVEGNEGHDDGATVLFFGRLSPYKGLEVLINAAPIVAEKVSNMRFVIAGKAIQGYSPPPLPVLVNGGKIELINQYITNSELARLFQQTTVVVCPYIDATQSGVILTAYAFGKPVIASSIGGIPEYVISGKTGILVEPRDPISLAYALIGILNDRDSIDSMRENISIMCSGKLGWNEITCQMFELYKRILSQDQETIDSKIFSG